ncbi:MAG: type II toxin-antitoxin system ParD family antitoxin [Rudaea sp.]|uniref:type II toxin-antitoxin system ParD family antitoxin n=1 Tax=Rudaea sp. TaxID=2136325 RepID=UPI0039E36344
MATMNISLPDELKAFVDRQVAEHAYGSTSEYLRDLIRKQRDIDDLRRKLLEGANSGPGKPMDKAFFDRLRKRAKARARQ